VRVNAPVLEAVLATLKQLSGQIEAEPPRLDGILAIRGVIDLVEAEEREEDKRAAEVGVLAGFEAALKSLLTMRKHEGAALGKVLNGRLDEIAALANAGTLAAFTAVGLCLLVLRKREPGRVRRFRTPLAWLVGPVAIGGCIYLFFSLPAATQKWFLVWNAVGLVVYVLYSRRRAVLGRG